MVDQEQRSERTVERTETRDTGPDPSHETETGTENSCSIDDWKAFSDDPGDSWLGTEPAGPQQANPVDVGVAALDETLEGIDPEDKEATNQTVLDGVSLYRDQLESLPPDQRAEFIRQSSDQIGELFRNADNLSYEETVQMVSALAEAGELAGRENIDVLASALGDQFAALVMGQQENGMSIGAGRMAAAFGDAMLDGKGALLNAALANDLIQREDYDAQTYGVDLIHRQREVMEQVANDQAESNERFEQLEGTFGNWVTNNYQLYGPEAIGAAEQDFRAAHSDEYAEAQRNNEVLASMLEGAAYTRDNGHVISENISSGLREYAVDGSDAILEQSVDLNNTYVQDDNGVWRQSDLRDQYVGDALLRSGDGETSWLDAANSLATEQGREGFGDELKNAELQASFQMSQVLTMSGRFDEVGTLMRGLAEHQPEFAPIAGDLSDRLGELQEQAASGDIEWDEAASLLGEAFAGAVEGADLPEDVLQKVMAMGVGVQGAMRYAESLGRDEASLEQFVDNGAGALGVYGDTDKVGGPGLGRLKAVGSGLGLVSGINDFIQGDRDFQSIVTTSWGGVQFVDDLVSTITRSGGSQLVKSIGLPVGLALAGLDVASKIASGASMEEIAVASLPLAGAGIGAAIGALFGGIGAGPGALAGLAIGSAIQFVGSLFGLGAGDPTEGYEDDTRLLTRGALEHVLGPNTTEETLDLMTDQFSKVDDDFVGIGPVAALVADEMGMHPHDFIRELGRVAEGENGEDVLSTLVDDNLLSADITNWSDIEDARDRIKDGDEVPMPNLEYADTDIAALAQMFENGLSDGDFSFVTGYRNQRNGDRTEIRQMPDLYDNYGQRRKEGGYINRGREYREADPFNPVSAADLDTWR